MEYQEVLDIRHKIEQARTEKQWQELERLMDETGKKYRNRLWDIYDVSDNRAERSNLMFDILHLEEAWSALRWAVMNHHINNRIWPEDYEH